MTIVHQLCRQEPEKVSEIMRKHQDWKTKHAPVYQPSDVVMLNGRLLQSARLAMKLNTKFHATFDVMKVRSRKAFSVEPPWRWQIHTAVHLSWNVPFSIVMATGQGFGYWNWSVLFQTDAKTQCGDSWPGNPRSVPVHLQNSPRMAIPVGYNILFCISCFTFMVPLRYATVNY